MQRSTCGKTNNYPKYMNLFCQTSKNVGSYTRGIVLLSFFSEETSFVTPLLFWCRTIPYQISSLNQMTFSRVWKMNFVLTGAGSSWLPKGVAQDGMWILLIQLGGWLLYRGLNYGGCTLRPSTSFQVSEREREMVTMGVKSINTAPVSHRSWVQIPSRPFFSGFLFPGA